MTTFTRGNLYLLQGFLLIFLASFPNSLVLEIILITLASFLVYQEVLLFQAQHKFKLILVSNYLLVLLWLGLGLGLIQLLVYLFILLQIGLFILNTIQVILQIQQRNLSYKSPFLNLFLHGLCIILGLAGYLNQPFFPLALGIYSILIIGILFISPNKGGHTKLHFLHRLPLPVWLEAILPYRQMNQVNHILANPSYWDQVDSLKDQQILSQVDQIIEIQNQLSNSLTIMVQSGQASYDRIGHVDLALNGQVFSYGNFDPDSRRLFDILGDGVCMQVDQASYLHYLMNRHVSIFAYVIDISPQVAKEIKRKISQLESQGQLWKPRSTAQLADFAGRMDRLAQAKFYKLSQGIFKNYNLFGANCVLMTGYLLQLAGLPLKTISAILSPGTLFDVLNHRQDPWNYQRFILSHKAYQIRNYMRNNQSPPKL